MSIHSKLTGPTQGIHVDYQWNPADDAAKTAISGTITADVGKLAYQIDTGAVWRLDSIGPNVWVPANVHGDQHKDGGDDELSVEDFATAGTVGQTAISDGAGGLAMGDIEDLSTAATVGQVVVSDGAAAMGPGDIEDISTAGAVGTIPISDGAAAVAMGDHGSIAGLGDDDHTQYSLADGTRAFTGVVSGVSPVADADLSTKKYTNDQISAAIDGGVSKANADAATTAALPANTRTADVLKGDAVGAFPTIDGIAAALNNVYLVKNEGGGASHINNGIYNLTVVGDGATEFELTRRSDLDNADDAAGAFLSVEAGTVNADRTFRCINNAGADVVNTDALQFVYWGATVDHDNLVNVSADDHHAESHTADHETGGAQEISIAALAGKAAAPQYPDNTIVFDPSVGASSGNVYKTYAEVDAAVVAMGGIPVEIIFIGACTIPAGGPYTATDTYWSVDLATPGTVAIALGASFTGLPRSFGTQLEVNNSALKPFSLGAGLSTTALGPLAKLKSTAGSLEMIDLASGAFLFVFSDTVSKIGDSGFDVISVQSGATVIFSFGGVGSELEDDSVSGAGDIKAEINNPGAIIGTTQSNHSGAFTYGTSGDGSLLVGYDKTGDVTITTATMVQAAIKELDEAIRRIPGTDVTAATYQVLVTDRTIRCDRASVIAVTLPAVADAGDGFRVTVKDWGGNAGANTITIDGDANIDGAASVTITVAYGALEFECDGTTWGVI